MGADAIAEAARTVAASRLARGRLGRLAGIDDLEAGYAVQEAANRLLEGRLGPPAGCKIGGTTAAMRAYLGLPAPIAGAIFAGTVHACGARLALGGHVLPGIETEIAVRLGRRLGPRARAYDRDEVAAAVAAVLPAIEIVDNRYEDFAAVGGPTLAADNIFNAALVTGEPAADWTGLDLGALRARTIVDGETVGEGTADALLGHPLDALAWLVERWRSLGRALEAGSLVSLGSITPVIWLERPVLARIEVERLGAVEVGFA